ncbi:hypothetical protein [Streptomyces violascens]
MSRNSVHGTGWSRTTDNYGLSPVLAACSNVGVLPHIPARR